MAAVSAAQTTTTPSATALTPPSSSHGNGFAWDSSLHPLEDPAYTQKTHLKAQASQNGLAVSYGSSYTHPDQLVSERAGVTRDLSAVAQNSADFTASTHDHENIRQGRSADVSIGLEERATVMHEASRNGVAGDSKKRSAAADAAGSEAEDVSSKWIHRDKLARIESEELQAAGIIFPKSRPRSKPRRDVSLDRTATHRKGGPESETHTEPRSRKNSTGISERKFADASVSSWDLRLPEEIAEASYFASPHSGRSSSRIPVAKLSPAPIALEHMERDTPTTRRRDDSPGVGDSISYPKAQSKSVGTRPGEGGPGAAPASPSRTLARSASDLSPKKAAGAAPALGLRKASAPAKATSTAGRPKTRNGTSKDSSGSGAGTTRPSTRSGDRELSRESSAGAASKQPEGEPPWMISAYRPDPRLPPEQQLLPTVARRLQQEKWEREGKFGNVYDREFRPLTDEGFPSPPGALENPPIATETAFQNAEKQDEWPLRPQTKSSAMHQARAGSYSTIPKIHDKPAASPLPSPRGPLATAPDASTAQPASSPLRDDDDGAKEGCGCCTVM